MFGRQLPFWGPKIFFRIKFFAVKLRDRNEISCQRVSSLNFQPIICSNCNCNRLYRYPCFFLRKKLHIFRNSLITLFFHHQPHTHGEKKTNNKSLKTSKTCFIKGKIVVFVFQPKKYPPCWSSKTTTSSNLAFRRSISSWSVWRFGSPKKGQPKRWEPKRTFWKSRLVAVQVDGLL